MILNPGVMQTKVAVGDVTVANITMTANMQMPLSGDISDAANITNLITVDTDTINETTENLMIPVNGRIKLQGGTGSWYEGDNSTELMFCTVDGDDTIDTVEDFAFLWKYGDAEGDSAGAGNTESMYTAITHKTFLSDFDWALGDANPFKLAMDTCCDTTTKTNDQLKTDWAYNEEVGLCDTATLDVSAIDYLDGMTDATMITLPGSMFNAPGTAIAYGVPGTDTVNERIFIKIPDVTDGEYDSVTPTS
jgi:hypothetical protein